MVGMGPARDEAQRAVPDELLPSHSVERPLLLWTDFTPDHAGGGAVILRSLVSANDRPKILWASPSVTRAGVSGDVAPLTAGSLGRTGRRSVLLDSTILARGLARETLRLAAARGARALWVVLHGAGVPVAAALVRQRDLPVHVTVHDDPAFAVAMRSRRYRALTPWIEWCFAKALRGAASVDVVSEAMRDRYKARYGVDAVVVHRGLRGPVTPSPTYDRAAHGLRIGVLGTVYSYGQLPVLARAVARAARVLSVPARLTLVGLGFAERLRADVDGCGVEVEGMGHLAEADAVEVLRRCFALYQNYPFAPLDAVLRETSFPTKLSTYVFAARPLLIHAPRDTTIAPLASQADYAHPWTTMNESNGEDVLARMWRNPLLGASMHKSAEAVIARYFDLDRNRRVLAGVLSR